MSSNIKKRIYDAASRLTQAEQARQRILLAATKLFEKNGFEKVTIESIANAANVSSPTVYAKFKSKKGLLQAIIDTALPTDQHDALVAEVYASDSANEQLKLAAKISRKLYDAEHLQMDWIRGAAIIDPAFRQREQEREERRYQRQKKTIQLMANNSVFSKQLSKTQARDILWALTGRDLYRLMVTERGWSPSDYETWLADTLIHVLLGAHI